MVYLIVIDGLLTAYTTNANEATRLAYEIKERNELRNVEILSVTGAAILTGQKWEQSMVGNVMV